MAISKRKDFIFNLIAGMINAGEAVILSAIVMRFGQLSDAGILTVAFAIGNVLLAVGKFGCKTFQVTDINEEFSFRTYVIQRLYAVTIMLLSLIPIIFFGGYSGIKRDAIVIIVIIYALESLEDCIWGRFQQRNHLYIGALLFIIRWISILCAFTIEIIHSHDMISALKIGVFVGAGVFIICQIFLIFRFREFYSLKKEGGNVKGIDSVSSIFYHTFPLFIAAFCAMFISNLPKFAIDRFMNDEVQACFGFVAMPVFVIGLLSQFVYQPKLVNMTALYRDDKIYLFEQEIKKQMVVIIGVSVVCIIGSAFLGIPVLSVLYNTDLRGYLAELLILQVAGLFLALSSFLSVLLTIIRKQNTVLAGYIIVSVIGTVVIGLSVMYWGTIGASLGFMGSMAILAAIYYYYFKKYIRQKWVIDYNDGVTNSEQKHTTP